VTKRPFENLLISECVTKSFFELGERVFQLVVHAAMLLPPRQHLADPGKTHVDLLSMGPRPIHTLAVIAPSESLGGGKHIWRDQSGDIVRRHLFEHPVAVAATGVFQIFRRRKLVPVEDLGELCFQDARVDHLGLRPRSRELAIAGEQPTILHFRNPSELRVLGFGPEVETVIAAQPEPTGQRTEHGVTQEPRTDIVVSSHLRSRIDHYRRSDHRRHSFPPFFGRERRKTLASKKWEE